MCIWAEEIEHKYMELVEKLPVLNVPGGDPQGYDTSALYSNHEKSYLFS